MSDLAIRCLRKSQCVLAWPEKCPAWDKWRCPVDEGQRPNIARAALAGVQAKDSD